MKAFLVGVLGAVLAAALALGAGQAAAQSYPSKPIKLVVGFPPGGGNDILARIVGEKLGKQSGQPVVVENKPGANAIIATQYVAQSPPDGYTLYVGASGAMAFNPGLYDRLPYDSIKDFAPITQLGYFPLVIGVNPSVSASSVKELIALAKSQPGKLFYAAGSTPFRVVTELFKMQAGVDIVHVPYKGSAQAITAAVSGEVAMVTVDAPPAIGQMKSGKLRALAVTGPKRWPIMPEIPTMAESGLPNFEVVLWTGLFAPAATPRPIVDKLHGEVVKILRMSDVSERLATLGYVPGGTTPAEFSAILKADLEKWTRVARENNIRAE